MKEETRTFTFGVWGIRQKKASLEMRQWISVTPHIDGKQSDTRLLEDRLLLFQSWREAARYLVVCPLNKKAGTSHIFPVSIQNKPFRIPSANAYLVGEGDSYSTLSNGSKAPCEDGRYCPSAALISAVARSEISGKGWTLSHFCDRLRSHPSDVQVAGRLLSTVSKSLFRSSASHQHCLDHLLTVWYIT